jgi:hypothetical protein
MIPVVSIVPPVLDARYNINTWHYLVSRCLAHSHVFFAPKLIKPLSSSPHYVFLLPPLFHLPVSSILFVPYIVIISLFISHRSPGRNVFVTQKNWQLQSYWP